MSANVSGWVVFASVDYGKLAIAGGLLLILMVLAYVGIMLLRRRLYGSKPQQFGGAFTLDDLRSLHQQGQLTQEEYERARQQTIAQFDLSKSSEFSKSADDENLRPPEGTSSS